MRIIVKKEENLFNMEITNIKTKEDIKEIIRQCQLVEGQIANGLNKCLESGITIENKTLFLSQDRT